MQRQVLRIVVVVMTENHSDSDVIDSSAAPYLNSLAGQGASCDNSVAITHPSELNYRALFSGANIGPELIAAGHTFTGFSESMPSDRFSGCTSGKYARKHNAAAHRFVGDSQPAERHA